MAVGVFLSVGRTATTDQEEFVQEFMRFLTSQGVTPRAVGRNEFSADRPLKFIDRVMRECQGTVVLAFERVYIEEGEELRGSPHPQKLAGSRLPTVWNQIEAAMAHTLGHPLLVVVENGLRMEGLLEPSQEWYVLRVNLDRNALTSPEFLGVFSDWKRRVEQPRSKSPQSVESISVSALWAGLTIGQAWGGGVAVVTALVAIVGAAYWFGSKFGVAP